MCYGAVTCPAPEDTSAYFWDPWCMDAGKGFVCGAHCKGSGLPPQAVCTVAAGGQTAEWAMTSPGSCNTTKVSWVVVNQLGDKCLGAEKRLMQALASSCNAAIVCKVHAEAANSTARRKLLCCSKRRLCIE